MKTGRLKASFYSACMRRKRKDISHLVVREGIDDYTLTHGVLGLRST